MKNDAKAAPAQSLLCGLYSPFTLQSGEVKKAWPRIEPFLNVIGNNLWPNEVVLEELKAAKAQLWGFFDVSGTISGIVITRFGAIGNRKAGTVWIASGRPMEAGIELLERCITPWFIEQGCDLIEVNGRKGWGRALEGYREVSRVFVKELR